MFESRTEIMGWIIGVLIVGAMAVLVFTGPYHKINAAAAVSTGQHYPPIHIKILPSQQTIGRYQPKVVTVHVGQEVIWSNDTTIIHTVTANNGRFDSGDIPVHGVFTYTPIKSGTDRYYCVYHPGMIGKLIVKS